MDMILTDDEADYLQIYRALSKDGRRKLFALTALAAHHPLKLRWLDMRFKRGLITRDQMLDAAVKWAKETGREYQGQ